MSRKRQPSEGDREVEVAGRVFVFRSGVPPTNASRGRAKGARLYPLEPMEPGESVDIQIADEGQGRSLRATASRLGLKLGRRYKCSVVAPGWMRVWRIE